MTLGSLRRPRLCDKWCVLTETPVHGVCASLERVLQPSLPMVPCTSTGICGLCGKHCPEEPWMAAAKGRSRWGAGPHLRVTPCGVHGARCALLTLET